MQLKTLSGVHVNCIILADHDMIDSDWISPRLRKTLLSIQSIAVNDTPKK